MDDYPKQDLNKLMEEVFYQEGWTFAELRLYSAEVQELTQSYCVKCVPMDDSTCADGKRWYHVWLLKL